jgi:hypothetical protein
MENPAIPFIENKFIPLIEHDVAERVMAEMAGKAKKAGKK